MQHWWRSQTKVILFNQSHFVKIRTSVSLSEIAIPINRYVINVGVSFGCSCDCGSIQFLLASFERTPGETHLHSNRDIYIPGYVSLSTAADSRSHEVSKMRDCFTWKFDMWPRLSGGLNAVEQHCCWDACQSSKWSNKIQSSWLRELIW